MNGIDDLPKFIKKWYGKNTPFYIPSDDIVTKMLKNNKIPFKKGEMSTTYKKCNLIYAPTNIDQIRTFLKKHKSGKNRLLMIPKFVTDCPCTIFDCDESVTIICRDPLSYDYCISCAYNARMTRKHIFYHKIDKTLSIKNPFQIQNNAQQEVTNLAFGKEGLIDAVIYINLDERKDRFQHINKLFKNFCIPPDIIYRITATRIKTNGHKGCANSHMRALMLAKAHGFKCPLILEDDFDIFNYYTKKMFHDRLKKLLEYDFDVMMLAGNTRKTEKGKYAHARRAIEVTTSSAYIVRNRFIKKLHDTIKTAHDKMHTVPDAKPIDDKNPANNKSDKIHKETDSLDFQWCDLQKKSEWYIAIPRIGRQLYGISDTERKVMDRLW